MGGPPHETGATRLGTAWPEAGPDLAGVARWEAWDMGDGLRLVGLDPVGVVVAELVLAETPDGLAALTVALPPIGLRETTVLAPEGDVVQTGAWSPEVLAALASVESAVPDEPCSACAGLHPWRAYWAVVGNCAHGLDAHVGCLSGDDAWCEVRDPYLAGCFAGVTEWQEGPWWYEKVERPLTAASPSYRGVCEPEAAESRVVLRLDAIGPEDTLAVRADGQPTSQVLRVGGGRPGSRVASAPVAGRIVQADLQARAPSSRVLVRYLGCKVPR